MATRTASTFEIRPRETKATSIDYLMLTAMAALTALGLLMLYTVTAPRLEAAGLSRTTEMARQAVFVGGGVVVMIAASVISDRMWRSLAPYAYGGAVVLLISGLLCGVV